VTVLHRTLAQVLVRKKKTKTPSREGTRRIIVCGLCGSRITARQRPSVRLQHGKEAHMECFVEQELHRGNPKGRLPKK